MPFANRATEAESIRRFLTGGGNLLVVGARSTNFPDVIRNHPRIRVWDSTDPASDNREIPENTRVIICTRFVAHALFGRLHKFAAKKHILMVPGLGNTGEIKEVVRIALNIPVEFTEPAPAEPADAQEIAPMQSAHSEPDAPDTSTDVDAVAAVPHKKGALKEFVQANLNLQRGPADEARRILPLAKEAGFNTTTHAAIAQTIYVLRNPAGLRAVKPETAAPAPVIAVPSNIGEALRLLDDAMAVLTLVREAVIKVKSDDEQTQDTMRQLRGFLERAPVAASMPAR